MKYDQKMLKEFLMHLAAELGVHKLTLEGKAASAGLLKGLQQLRSKYGTDLLPAPDIIDILDRTQGDSQVEVARQGMVENITKQSKHVLGVLTLLNELTFSEAPPA